jgi:hypothetical protein
MEGSMRSVTRAECAVWIIASKEALRVILGVVSSLTKEDKEYLRERLGPNDRESL